MALLGAQPTSAQPERDFSAAGLVLSSKSSTLDSRSVEVRLFNKFNKRFRPSADRPAGKTDECSDQKALGIPILRRSAVQSMLPGWAPADNCDDGTSH